MNQCARPVHALALVFALVLPAWYAAAADGSPVDKAPEQRRREFEDRIKALQERGTDADFQRLVEDVKVSWGPAKDADYFRTILKLCGALDSTGAAHPGRFDLARQLATTALDDPADKPIEVEVKLLLCLQSDPDYTKGELRGERWEAARPVRARRWLARWRTLKEQTAKAEAAGGPVTGNVMPPRKTGLPSGIDPSEIKDPVLRKEYEDAIARNTERGAANRRKYDLDHLEPLFTGAAKRYLIDAYSKPPFQTDELAKSLQEYGIPQGDRDAILAEVKKREAAYAEREAHAPPAPHPELTQPAPPGDTPVHTDPRLRVPLSFDLASPSVDDLLRELHKATGVDFTHADGIQNKRPAFGSLSLRGVPAWQVMDDVAASKRVEGRWEVDGAGYRLVPNGNPVVIPEDAPSKSAGAPADDRPQRLILTVGSLVLIAAVFAAMWGYRLGKKSRPPSA